MQGSESISSAVLLLFFVAGVVSGCATVSPTNGETPDPFENVNRPLYDFNEFLDEKIGEPVADAYIMYVHENIRLSVSNFYDNLRYLNVIVNDVLQGKGRQGLSDVGRFLVNTTLGVGGLFDVASVWEWEKHNEDFGQTLAVWGLNEGSYLVLPFIGPNSTRDVPDLITSTLTNVFFYVGAPVTIPVGIVGFVDRRARADKAIRLRDETAVEPYVFTREAYFQHRNFLIYDGHPPLPDDFLEDSYAEQEKEGSHVSETENPSAG